MRTNRKAWQRFFFLVFISITCVSCAAIDHIYEIHPDEIIILHTNDVHGNIRAMKATWISRENPPLCGGTASMMTFIREWRRAAGGDTGILLLDGGDIFQGTPEGNETRGSLMIALMNLMKYDAGALGNHEFDFGVENVKRLLSEAKFPLMAENVYLPGSKERPPEIDAPVILTHRGIKIGFAGLVTEHLRKVTGIENDPSGWHADSELPAARRAAQELRARGAEMVILLTHCGLEHDTMLAEHADDDDTAPGAPIPARIDAIIGGHSHTRLETAVEQNGVPIVQTGCYSRAVGELRIRWDRAKNRVRSYKYRLVDMMHSRYPEDTEVKAFLKPWFEDIDKRMNRIVGRALKPIMRGPRKPVSSPLGNLQTDIMRAATGVEIAFQNKGGIRADVPEGELRLRDLYAVSPFGNTVFTMKLPGSKIRAILEQSLGYGTTPLEFSGITVFFDASRRVGDRVVNIFVNDTGLPGTDLSRTDLPGTDLSGGALPGSVMLHSSLPRKPLDETRLYTVATNSFLGGGGDGYPWFKEGIDARDTGRNFLDIEVAYYENHPEGVSGNDEMRWKAID